MPQFSRSGKERQELEQFENEIQKLPLGDLIDLLFTTRLSYYKAMETGSDPVVGVTEKSLLSLQLQALRLEINSREVIRGSAKPLGGSPISKKTTRRKTGVSTLGHLF